MTSAVGSGVDRRLQAGAPALVLAALMAIPVLFWVHPPTDPGHGSGVALAANGFSDRLGWSLPPYAFVPVILGTFAPHAAVVGTADLRWAIGGFLHDIGLIIRSVAVWRSQTLSRSPTALLAASGVVGVPAHLDLNVFRRIVPVVLAAALTALTAATWRQP